jgi:electron transfer flavoprotein alpha subunit
VSATVPAGMPVAFIETRGGKATAGSLGLLAKARALGGSAGAVVCGPDAAAVAGGLARYGSESTFVADVGGTDPSLGQAQVGVLATLVRDHGVRTILFENSVLAADVAAGLAARLDAGVNWDLQDLAMRDGALVGTRYALDDSVAVDVGWIGEVQLAVFRLGLNDPVEAPVDGHVVRLEADIPDYALATRIVEVRGSSAEGATLATADIIVAGGRGMRDRETLGLLEDLADALGGVVAVSMPIVDRGWYPHSRQVGQTGQKVRPRLYIACGISGQLGHRVGMEKSGVIVAINSDPTAPIFGICDAGVVGDLHAIVPELTGRIRAAHGSASGQS